MVFEKVFLFTLNPYLAIKNKLDFDFLGAIKANKKLINENNSKYEPLSVDSVKKIINLITKMIDHT